jgi:hypothetical protein
MLLDLRAVGGELEWLTSGHAMCPVVVDDVSVSGD